jgi:thymidine kinase
MKSAKTLQLLSFVEAQRDHGRVDMQDVLFIGSRLNTRDGEKIRSRAFNGAVCTDVDCRVLCLSEAFEHPKLRTATVVCIDELHMFQGPVASDIKQLMDRFNVKVAAAGILFDMHGAAFPGVISCMALSTNIVTVTARCVECSGKATMTRARYVATGAFVRPGDDDLGGPGDEGIIVDDKTVLEYEPCCADHHPVFMRPAE